MNTYFYCQSVSSIESDAASERNQEAVNGEAMWSAEPALSGHTLSLPAGHHNEYLKGKTSQMK